MSDTASAPDFGRSVFVCSKPLQVLHCASIVRHYEIDSALLYIHVQALEDHRDFRVFMESSAYGRLFTSIRWADDAMHVARILRDEQFESLFIEDDRVSFYNLFAPLKTRWLILFEEGVGTYRGQYVDTMSWPRKLKWRIMAWITGCGFNFGYGRKTDFVVVQRPELYRRLNPRMAYKVRPFPGLVAELEAESETWAGVLSATLEYDELTTRRGCFVLGTWGGTPDLDISKLVQRYDKVFFKAHPHDGAGSVAGATTIHKSWVPAEVYIDHLARRCEQVAVFHYSSSAAFYMRNQHSNVSFHDLLQEPRLLDILEA